jgi:hypothetical protein
MHYFAQDPKSILRPRDGSISMNCDSLFPHLGDARGFDREIVEGDRLRDKNIYRSVLKRPTGRVTGSDQNRARIIFSENKESL